MINDRRNPHESSRILMNPHESSRIPDGMEGGGGENDMKRRPENP